MKIFSPELDDPETAKIMYGSKLNGSETATNFRESLQEKSLLELSTTTKSTDSIYSSVLLGRELSQCINLPVIRVNQLMLKHK